MGCSTAQMNKGCSVIGDACHHSIFMAQGAAMPSRILQKAACLNRPCCCRAMQHYEDLRIYCWQPVHDAMPKYLSGSGLLRVARRGERGLVHGRMFRNPLTVRISWLIQE